MNSFCIALCVLLASFLTHRYMLCCLSVVLKNSCKLWQNHQAVNHEGKNRTKGVWKNLNMASLCVCIVRKPVIVRSDSFPSPSPSPAPFCTGPVLSMSCLLCYFFMMWTHAPLKYQAEYRMTFFSSQFFCWCCTVVSEWFACVSLIWCVPLVMNKVYHTLCLEGMLMYR